jgi:hypothetical protein
MASIQNFMKICSAILNLFNANRQTDKDILIGAQQGQKRDQKEPLRDGVYYSKLSKFRNLSY